MNIAEAFADFMESSLGIATLGQDLFIGEAPDSNVSPDALYWITTSGGNPVNKMHSGEVLKQYTINVFYRDTTEEAVYNELQSLEESVNCNGCTQLEGYETVDIEATTFPVDDDLDSEDRKVGLLQVTLTTYKECNDGVS